MHQQRGAGQRRGAFSPFGDITTLMVWQAGRVPFGDFFQLLVPSVVNWLVPAAILSLAIRGRPARAEGPPPTLQPGGIAVLILFLGTVPTTVLVHSLLDLPPALGMMAGLGVLKTYAYLFNRHRPSPVDELDDVFAEPQIEAEAVVEECVAAGERLAVPLETPATGTSPAGAAVLVASRSPASTLAPRRRPPGRSTSSGCWRRSSGTHSCSSRGCSWA